MASINPTELALSLSLSSLHLLLVCCDFSVLDFVLWLQVMLTLVVDELVQFTLRS